MLIRVLSCCLVFSCSIWGGIFSFSSNFEGGDTEGWTIFTPVQGYVGGVGPTAPLSGGLASSGFLEAEDAANGYLYFIAPPSWAGDLLGGTLSFYLRNLSPNLYTDTAKEPTVRVEGSNGLVIYYSGLPGAGNDWNLNQLIFFPGPNWRLGTELSSPPASAAQVIDTLSDVVSIGILADWVARYAGHPLGDFGPDITGLDDVTLVSIPEPGSALLVLAGLGSLAWRRRRG